MKHHDFRWLSLVFGVKVNEPEAADSIFEISMFESISPCLVCFEISCARVFPEGRVQDVWWQFGNFGNLGKKTKLHVGADFEGSGASKEPLDFLSRAA